MFDLLLLVLVLALALIVGVCLLRQQRKIGQVEAIVQALQEREEMRTILHDSSISLKWGRKLVQVLETDPEQLRVTQPSMRSLLSRKY